MHLTSRLNKTDLSGICQIILCALAASCLSAAPALASEAFDLRALVANYKQLASPKPTEKLTVEQAQKLFSKKWLPVLLAADARDDPLGILLLRDCTAMPLLDRQGIASTCGDATEQARAFQLLEKSSFAATYKHINEALELRKSCGGSGYLPDCDVNTSVAVYESWLQAVRADGAPFLPGQHVRPFACRDPNALNIKSADPTSAAINEKCLDLQQRTQAVQRLAPQFLHTQLVRDLKMIAEDGPVGYQKLAAPRFFGKKDGRAVNDASAAFYGRVFDVVLQIDAQVAAKTSADPRLGQLLFNVQREFDATPSGKALKKSKAVGKGWEIRDGQHAGLNTRDRHYAKRYVGVYKGPMISNGTSHAITSFFMSYSGHLGGRYLLFYGSGQGVRVERGALSPCIPATPSELICVWKDRFGDGMASFLFDEDAAQFKGIWSFSRAEPDAEHNALTRMEPRWLGERTSWDGQRY